MENFTTWSPKVDPTVLIDFNCHDLRNSNNIEDGFCIVTITKEGPPKILWPDKPLVTTIHFSINSLEYGLQPSFGLLWLPLPLPFYNVM